MPIHASSGPMLTAVQTRCRRRSGGRRRAHLVELALQVERVRREQLAEGLRYEDLAVDEDSGRIGCDAVGVEVDGPGAVGDLGDDLDRRPEAARPRERDGVPPELDAPPGRRRGRAPGCAGRRASHADELGSVDDFAPGIVAHQRDAPPWLAVPANTAWRMRVAGPVQPGRLAVPDADHAVVAESVQRGSELGAHDRGRSELLVHRRPAHHAELVGWASAATAVTSRS